MNANMSTSEKDQCESDGANNDAKDLSDFNELEESKNQISSVLKRRLEGSSTDPDALTPPKKRRSHLTLEVKLEIINLHENGLSNSLISREKGVSESSIRTILQKREEIKQRSSNIGSFMLSSKSRQRSYSMENMERLLLIWIGDLHKKGLPISMPGIRTKAKSLFPKILEFFKCSTGSEKDEKFSASNGWFDRFKLRSGLVAAKMGGGALKVGHKSINGDDERICMNEATGLFTLNLPNFEDLPNYDHVSTSESEYISDENLLKLLEIPNAPSSSDSTKKSKNLRLNLGDSKEVFNYEMPLPIKEEYLYEDGQNVDDSFSVSYNNETPDDSFENIPDGQESSFTILELSSMLKKVDEITNFLIQKDPVMERSQVVKNSLQGLFKCYRDILQRVSHKNDS